jgi:hypothetical protein
MTVTPEPPEPTDRPLDLGGVPDAEDVSAADAAERVELDPEEQKNRTDPEGDGR